MTTTRVRDYGALILAGAMWSGCASDGRSDLPEDDDAAADDDGDGGDNGGSSDPDDDGSASDAPSPDGDDDGDDAQTESSEGGGGETGGFIQEPDGAGVNTQCDIWNSSDCPEGEKCMPWASDGGSAWNGTRCTPLDRAPGQMGDPCTVEGSGVSGIDDCDLGKMCWDVDPETNMGTCVDFCTGSEANPVCTDPATQCVIANEGVLILCLPTCNPLLSECSPGQACYPIDDGFACGPDASGEQGAFGEACEFINVCDPGLFCASPEAVPGCVASAGCCSPFCDLGLPDPDASCPGAAEGQACVPWYEEGQVPPGLDDVGACAIPA